MAGMQFWGVEVKGKEPCKVKVEEGHVIHLSQAVLGELKKEGEPVTMYVNVDGKKLVMGILSPGSNPQLSFDLVFEKEFEVSHNWKDGSVHLMGYQSEMPEDEDEFSDFSDEEEAVQIPHRENGKPAAAAVPKVTANPTKETKPEEEEKEDEEDDSDDEETSDEDDSDEDMHAMGDESGEDDEDSDDEDSSDSEDGKPAKAAEAGKKRDKPEAKTPDAKKAKLVTPQKTDGKKGGAPHTATPHPSKKGEKNAAGNKSTPKSGGQVSCGSCKKTFNSENALQSHTKAKHSGK